MKYQFLFLVFFFFKKILKQKFQEALWEVNVYKKRIYNLGIMKFFVLGPNWSS